jgi:hypothetical protein
MYKRTLPGSSGVTGSLEESLETAAWPVCVTGPTGINLCLLYLHSTCSSLQSWSLVLLVVGTHRSQALPHSLAGPSLASVHLGLLCGPQQDYYRSAVQSLPPSVIEPWARWLPATSPSSLLYGPLIAVLPLPLLKTVGVRLTCLFAMAAGSMRGNSLPPGADALDAPPYGGQLDWSPLPRPPPWTSSLTGLQAEQSHSALH